MQSIYVTFVQYTYSVVEPEPRFLARAVKKGAAPALQLKFQLRPYV